MMLRRSRCPLAVDLGPPILYLRATTFAAITKQRSNFMRRTWLVFGSLALVLVLPVAGIGQGKSVPIPATVTFNNGDDFMIRGDGISASIGSQDGNLYLLDNDETDHRLHLYFDVQTLDPPSPNCREWGKEPTYFMPPADDLETPRAVQIWTFTQFVYTDNGWEKVMNPPQKGWRTNTEHWLDFRRDVKRGTKAYVQFLMRVWVNSTNDYYDLLMNRVWPWGTIGTTWNGGIVEVEASVNNADPPGAAGDTFILRPVVGGQSPPLPGLVQNEALLRAIDQSDFSRDTSGPCHMGQFLMPFEMTVTRK
jgi:hypothetical protein